MKRIFPILGLFAATFAIAGPPVLWNGSDARFINSGSVIANPGSSPTPGVVFGDADTGIYGPSTSTVGFTSDGNETARFDSNGLIIGGTANADSAKLRLKNTAANLNVLQFENNTGAAAKINWSYYNNFMHMSLGTVPYLTFDTTKTFVGIGYTGAATPKYRLESIASSTSTAPGSVVADGTTHIPPIFVSRNTNSTVGNYGGLMNAGSSSNINGYAVWYNDTQTASSEDSRFALAVASGGTKTERLKLSKDGALTLSGYGSGVLSSDSSGNITAGTYAPGQSVNLLILDSAYASKNPDDSGAEVSVGRWTHYADAAATTPVDMTGGSPGATAPARSTSSPLNGAASIVYDLGTGSSRQGEGMVSGTVYVPPGYRGRTVQLSGVYSVTGTITDGDIVPYAYDITNSVLIAPYVAGKIIGSSGKMVAHLQIPSTCATLRIGFHVARTATTALSIKFDDLKLTDDVVPVGLAGSNTQSVSMTASAGFGTVSSAGYIVTRVADRAYFEGRFVAGTVAASTASIDIPSGMVIDTAKMASTSSNGVIVGTFQNPDTGAGPTALSTRVLFFDGSDTNTIFFGYRGASNALNKENGSTLFANSQLVTFKFDIPIAGWDANVTMAQSSTFRISSYLANGTRVTGSAPTALGQYRSYLRNSSANTWTETSGDPTATPSVADGVKVYSGNAWNTADTNNNPSRYDIFVGKNKHVKWEFYNTTGRTGEISIAPHYAGTYSLGYKTAYDPTTGIASIYPEMDSSITSDHRAGSDSAANWYQSAYFDIVVSENALAVGVQSPRSEVTKTTGAGHGSSATKVRRIETAHTSRGGAITYASDSTNGTTFTINEDGIYSIHYTDRDSDGMDFGIVKGSVTTTTAFSSQPSANRLGGTTSPSNAFATVSWTGYLAAGEVIRPMTDGTTTNTNNMVQFTITKVSD